MSEQEKFFRTLNILINTWCLVSTILIIVIIGLAYYNYNQPTIVKEESFTLGGLNVTTSLIKVKPEKNIIFNAFRENETIQYNETTYLYNITFNKCVVELNANNSIIEYCGFFNSTLIVQGHEVIIVNNALNVREYDSKILFDTWYSWGLRFEKKTPFRKVNEALREVIKF